MDARGYKKMFCYVGLPILGFYFFLATIYFAFVGGVMLVVFIVGACCLQKKDIWCRLNKLAIAMFCFYFILLPNPLMWSQQIERHINPTLLITPNEPEVQALNNTDKFWDWLSTAEGLSIEEFNALDEPTKLHHFSDYCLFIVKWTSINEQYGVTARVATPEEAINSGKGDCQAQTVTTVSLLIFLGYNAYAAETPGHWYPVVFLANGTPVHMDRTVGVLNLTASDPEVLINNKGIFYTKNWASLIPDMLFNPHFNRNFINMFLQNPLMWTFLPFILLGAGILLKTITSAPNRSGKKQIIKEGSYTGILLNGGFLLATLISFAAPVSTLIILLIVLVLTVQITSHNLFHKVSPQNTVESSTPSI